MPKQEYTITDLPQKPAVKDTDYMVIDTGTVTYKVPLSLVKEFLGAVLLYKAGDTMTGRLTMAGGSNGLRLLSPGGDKYDIDAKELFLSIANKNNQGIFIPVEDSGRPRYYNGPDSFRLLTENDLVKIYITDFGTVGENWYFKLSNGWSIQGGRVNNATQVSYMFPVISCRNGIFIPTSRFGDYENWYIYNIEATNFQIGGKKQPQALSGYWIMQGYYR